MKQINFNQMFGEQPDNSIDERFEDLYLEQVVVLSYNTPQSDDRQEVRAEYVGVDETYVPGEYDPSPPRLVFVNLDDEAKAIVVYPARDEICSVSYETFSSGNERRIGDDVDVDPVEEPP